MRDRVAEAEAHRRVAELRVAELQEQLIHANARNAELETEIVAARAVARPGWFGRRSG